MNSVSPLSHFANLDADVLLHIICLLHPTQLLSLRATCKFLRDLTYKKVVWLNALNALVPRLQLSTDAFPAEDLSIAEIEDAVLRPYRFQRNILQSQPDVKALSVLFRPKDEGVYSRHYSLIPGGRWLLSSDNLGMLKLWDLQSPSTTMACAAQIQLPGETNFDLRVQAHPSGRGAIVLVSSLERIEGAPHPREYIHVVELNSIGPVPLFEKRAVISNFGRLAFATILGDFVASTTIRGTVVVWNWVTDSWVEMIDPDRRGNNHDIRVKLNGNDTLTTFDALGGSSRTFPIPPLDPCAGDQCPPSEIVPSLPVSRSTTANEPRGIFPTLFLPNEWSTSPHPGPAVLASARQIVVFTPDNTVRATIPWTRSYLSSAHKASTATTVDGETVVVMTNAANQLGRPLEVHVVGPGDKQTSSFTVDLPWKEEGEMLPAGPAAWKVLFCPVSGVVCMLHPAGPVHVFDFAAPV